MNPILIIGAGPSECQVDYQSLPEKLDTFGMNLMYRFYSELHWEPTYFGCFDHTVAQCQEQGFKALIEGETKIRHFYMVRKVSDSPKLTTLKLHGKTGDFSMSFERMGYGGCTGVNCAQVAAILGYRRILLVGMDGYPSEKVDGTIQEGKYLVVQDAPKTNANYSRSDYQREGDKFNFPKSEKFHRPAWKSFARFAFINKIEVVNCSWGEVANFYPRSTLADEMEAMKK